MIARMTCFAAALLAAQLGLPAMAAQTQPSISRQIFFDADLNRDGFVDLDEFHKDIVNSFHALDHNRDGTITVEEMRAIPDKGRVEALLMLLKRADTNGDGKLSFKEVVEVRMDNFARADTNRDDKLSLEEVVAFDAKGTQQFSTPASAKAKQGSASRPR
jgi:Ca2+-binding EF-hand superfamily protein